MDRPETAGIVRNIRDHQVSESCVAPPTIAVYYLPSLRIDYSIESTANSEPLTVIPTSMETGSSAMPWSVLLGYVSNSGRIS